MHNYLFFCIIFSALILLLIFFLLHNQKNNAPVCEPEKEIENLRIKKAFFNKLLREMERDSMTDEECNLYGMYMQAVNLYTIYIHALLTENALLVKQCKFEIEKLKINYACKIF